MGAAQKLEHDQKNGIQDGTWESLFIWCCRILDNLTGQSWDGLALHVFFGKPVQTINLESFRMFHMPRSLSFKLNLG